MKQKKYTLKQIAKILKTFTAKNDSREHLAYCYYDKTNHFFTATDAYILIKINETLCSEIPQESTIFDIKKNNLKYINTIDIFPNVQKLLDVSNNKLKCLKIDFSDKVRDLALNDKFDYHINIDNEISEDLSFNRNCLKKLFEFEKKFDCEFDNYLYYYPDQDKPFKILICKTKDIEIALGPAYSDKQENLQHMTETRRYDLRKKLSKIENVRGWWSGSKYDMGVKDGKYQEIITPYNFMQMYKYLTKIPDPHLQNILSINPFLIDDLKFFSRRKR